MGIGHWFLNFFGISNLSGYGYGFFSGIGSDLGEVALIGAIIAIYRKHNCHVRRCWRVSRHPVKGTPWVVCRKHHPGMTNESPTAEQVAHDHAVANNLGESTVSAATASGTWRGAEQPGRDEDMT